MRILFVCLGNICRSPTAEAAAREALVAAGLAERVELDSAGTGDWHLGQPPDPRMTTAAADAGLSLSGRARQLRRGDLDAFDLVLAMDRKNLEDVRALAAGRPTRAQIRLLREFDEDGSGTEVPDPYYGGPAGFTEVVRIARSATRGLVRHLQGDDLRAGA